jgi:RNA polymerase sigma-70 factor (ECF subfamily)
MKRLKKTHAPTVLGRQPAGSVADREGIVNSAVRCDPNAQAEPIMDCLREQMIAFLPRLSRFALSLTGSLDRRDDLVQETCARALAHRDQWQPGTRLDSWMFRIAQNLWFDWKRAEKYRGESVDIDAVSDLVDTDGRITMENRLELSEVLRGLDQLPPEHRVLVALVCVEGLTYREAGEILGIPMGTVMSRLARARLALFDAMHRGPTSSNGRTTAEVRRGRTVR